MSIGTKMGCFTLNWEIKNFSIFLSKYGITLKSPYMKRMASGKCEWSQLCIHGDINFGVRNLKSYNTIEAKFEVSFISSCGEVPNMVITGKKSINAATNMVVPKDTILANKQAFLPNDTVTICFKMWEEVVESGEMHIRTVLHRDNFLWNIEEFRTNRSNKYTNFIEKEDILFTMILEGPDANERYKFELKNVSNHIVGGHMFFVECEPSMLHYQAHFIKANDDDIGTWQMAFYEEGKKYNNVTIKLASIYAVHKKLKDPSSSLKNNLLHLYKQALHCDATLNADGKSFPAHKSILSARSEVFRSMFEKQDTSEGRSGVVDIKDIDSDTVDRMLVFLYSDKLINDINWEQASALYYAADKYAIVRLKKKCLDILKARLAPDNACKAVVLAERHADHELMRCVVDFIREHNEVISSSDWEELEESDSGLTTKIMREVLLKKRKIE